MKDLSKDIVSVLAIFRDEIYSNLTFELYRQSLPIDVANDIYCGGY